MGRGASVGIVLAILESCGNRVAGGVDPSSAVHLTGVNRVPEQQHSSDHATEERTLEGVAWTPWFGWGVPWAVGGDSLALDPVPLPVST